MEKEHFEEKKTYGCRMSPDTVKLLNDNYQYITGTDESLFFKEFFVRLLDKALVNKEIQIPEDKFTQDEDTITLQNKIEQLTSDIQTLEQQNSELKVQKTPGPPVIPISGKPDSIVLEDVKPAEQWFIQQYAIQLEITPKVLLVDKMLIQFIKTGKATPFKAPPVNVNQLFSQLTNPVNAEMVKNDIKEQKSILNGK